MTPRNQQGAMRPGVAIGLALLALVVLILNMRGCVLGTPWRSGLWFPGLHSFPHFYGLLSIWGLIQTVLAIWVGVDAQRKNQNGVLWGLLVFFTGIVGLVVYLLVMPTLLQRNGTAAPAAAAVVAPAPAVQTPCRGCGRQINPEFKVCPYCGVPLGCSQCGKPVESGWKLCPHCGQAIRGGDVLDS